MPGERGTPNVQESHRAEVVAELLNYPPRIEPLAEALHQLDSAISVEAIQVAIAWIGRLSEPRTPKTFFALLDFFQRYQDWAPITPEAYPFCFTLTTIQRQADTYLQLFAEQTPAMINGKRILWGMVGPYQLFLHRHDCNFGAGLIMTTIHDPSLPPAVADLYHVSFYPSDPVVIYEVKGSESVVPPEDRKPRKKAFHRFQGKMHMSPRAVAAQQVFEIAHELSREVLVSRQTPLRRNVSVWGDSPEARARLERQNRQYTQLRQELSLYDEEPGVEGLIATVQALNESLTVGEEKEYAAYEDLQLHGKNAACARMFLTVAAQRWHALPESEQQALPYDLFLQRLLHLERNGVPATFPLLFTAIVNQLRQEMPPAEPYTLPKYLKIGREQVDGIMNL